MLFVPIYILRPFHPLPTFPLVPAALQSINFQELAADLAEITFKFPFRIPPYFALVRVFSCAL